VRRFGKCALILAGLGAATSCVQRDPADQQARVAARHALLEERRAAPDTAPGTPVAKWILPPGLGEISGLVLTRDGRLVAHDDELGRVTVIDARGGVLLKQFNLGDRQTLADFEGITMVNDVFYMVTSRGALYEFREGLDGDRVHFTIHDLNLGQECEIEGVAHDAQLMVLVMPCKNVLASELKDQLVLYRWPLGGGVGSQVERFTMPLETVIGSNDWKQFRPTDIAVDPKTGHYVLVAAQEQGLLEMTRTGQVIRSMPLPGDHPQAEGIAITPDGLLIVSDESGNHSATITVYRWPLAAGEKSQP
jgi:DNA-binding beta-propeller fold protein YncE